MQIIIDTKEDLPLLPLYAQLLISLHEQSTNQEFPEPSLPVPAGTPRALQPIPESVNPNPPAVDSTGLPWDDRIHSSTKAITSGVWRKRRGVSDQVVAAVTAELKARGAAGGQAPQAATLAPLTAPVLLPPTGTPVLMPPAAVGVPPQVPSLSGPVATVPAPIAPDQPAAVADNGQLFNELMLKFSRLGAEKGWQPDVLNRAVASAGLASVNELLSKPVAFINLVSMTLDNYAQYGVK